MMKSTVLFPVFLFLLAFCHIGNGQEAHRGARAANGSLFFKAEPLNNTHLSTSEEVYYYIHLEGDEPVVTEPKERIPLNLSVVLDKSGSMSGEKIAHAKEALKYIIRHMHETDLLSIVLYDTKVNVLMKQQRLENKARWLKLVDGIAAGTSTYLEGGIREGYKQIKSAKKLVPGEMVNRVMLLSDGLANHGLTDSEQLSGITEGWFKEEQISISTFGVGADYNEDLMSNIALQGGGKYYFIDSPEQLSSMFEEELNGISRVVAKNTQLKITFPKDLIAHKKTYAYNSRVRGSTLEIDFNDVFANEQKSILIAFTKKNKTQKPIDFTCDLTYLNAGMNDPVALADQRTSTIAFTKSQQAFDEGYNKSASEGYALEISAELYEEATALCNQRQFKKATAKTQEAIQFLDQHFEQTGENTYLRTFQQNLKEYESLIEDMKKMDRVSFNVNLKRQKHHRSRAIACPKF